MADPVDPNATPGTTNTPPVNETSPIDTAQQVASINAGIQAYAEISEAERFANLQKKALDAAADATR